MPPPRTPFTNRPMPLGAQVPGLLQKAYERHGFAQGQVLAQWTEIVGPELADFTRPERIRWPRQPRTEEARPGRMAGGTLVVRVDGPAAIELQHSTPQIIERINVFYGYRAITSLKVVQGPIPRRERQRRRIPERLDDIREARIAEKVSGIEDERLKATLSKLGRSIMFSKK